jgi:hypothetical protein
VNCQVWVRQAILSWANLFGLEEADLAISEQIIAAAFPAEPLRWSSLHNDNGFGALRNPLGETEKSAKILQKTLAKLTTAVVKK